MNIFKLSPFVEKQFKQSPELFDLISGDFDLEKDWSEYKKHHSHLDIFSLPRIYRQSRLALIAARDIENNTLDNHIKTLNQTSLLARLMIQFAYETTHKEFISKYGEVINNNGESQQLIIYALGKLGGNELNYSSDVDLVFCFSGYGESNGRKCLDAQNYFNRMGRRIIQILDSFTNNGIVYRVDMRLRPFGSAAPLVCRCANLLDYLETEGRDWERYAWLRASFIAGDKHIGQKTLNQIQPFIYRKYLDYTIFESLRQIKAQISRKQLDDIENIKLGKGGIREIEFIVQTLQLTFAGRNKQLRGNDLWLQMHNLQDHNHLSVKELQQLSTAWLFLRKVENLCQIIHDSDSHHLPEDTKDMAQCMGFNNSEMLLNQLNSHRENVHSIFEQLFLSNKTEQEKNQRHPEIQLIKDKISNKNYPKANKHKMYAALDALIPHLNDNSAILIQRYQQVINAVSKRPNYLSMLIENPIILERLIQQLSHGNYFSNVIAKMPTLLEVLFDHIDDSDFDLTTQWQKFICKFNITDEESYLEHICQFKQHIQFKAVMAYIDGLNKAKKTCEILSDLAQFILSLVIDEAWKATQKKIKSQLNSNDLIVIAYGSMAMRNMHLDSDFDLVFILDKKINDNHKFVMRWIKRIILLLSIKTYSGSLYQLDTQLRPNGKSGAAVVTKENFENYQIHDAWIWEHAALIKSRAVFATEKQKQWYKNLKENIITRKRNPELVDKALNEMATKLNQVSKKNHQKEFKNLGTILKKAHSKPEIAHQLLKKNTSYKTKLDQSIAAF